MSGKKGRKKKQIPLEDRFICDPEVQAWQAVEKRIKGTWGRNDSATRLAMEEPVRRLMGASMLFYDLATAVHDSPMHDARDIQTMGLVFLSYAMKREAERLFTLYHGEWPSYG